MKTDMSKQDQIRKVFIDIDGGCIPRVTRECMERGIWSEDEIRNAAFRTFKRDVKDALKIINPITMLPWALETIKVDDKDGSGAKRYEQLTLMDYDDVAYNIMKRDKGMVHDYNELSRLHSYCMERFGKAPAIHLLVDPTHADAVSVSHQPEERH